MRVFGLFAILVLLTQAPVYAEDDKNSSGPNIAEGMEIRKIKGFNLLVPKDAKVRFDGDVLKVEDPTEYSAARFIKIEKRFEEIDRALKSLQEQIDELKAKLDEIKEAE